MIDLTPLDVRNKRGDFKKLMRGYDPQEVDVFLEIVAERLEALVRENLQLRERTQTLQQQVTSQLGREQAVQDALVTAQELRADIRSQSQREAEHALKEAQTEGRRIVAEAEAEARTKLRDAERRIDGAQDALIEFERRRARFLKEFRQLLERELDVVEVEEGREPLETRTIDLDLGPSTSSAPAVVSEEAGSETEDTGSGPEGEIDEDVESPTDAVDELGGDAGAEDDAVEESEWRADDGTTGSAPFAEYVDEEEEGGAEPEPEVIPSAEAVEEVTPEAPAPPTDGLAAKAAEAQVEELAATFEVEAVAEAGSQVVEITTPDDSAISSVPRLEEVLAEAGAELSQTPPEAVTPGPDGEEISPPPVGGHDDETFLLYLESEEPDR